MSAFITNDTICSRPVIDLLRPVGMGLNLVHLVAPGALDYAAAGSKNLDSIVVLLFCDSHHRIDKLHMGGMDDCATNEAVGSLVAVDDTTINTLFEIDTPDGGRVLVPASDDLITDIDTEARTISVIIPEGLLEL